MKNLKLFVVFVSIILVSETYSQSGWFWQNPYPTSNQINDIYISNPDNIIAVCNGGLILKTTNDGINWCLINSNYIRNLNKLNFINQNTGYVAGSGGIVLKTINSGNNWNRINSPDQIDYSSVYFINTNTGWLTGHNNLLKTTDQGVTWNLQTADINEILDIYFHDTSNGWAIGSVGIQRSGTIIHTTNGGLDWFSLATGFNNPVISLFFINIDTGWISDSGGRIWKTYDSGINWSLLATIPFSTRSIYFSNALTGYIATLNGGILLKSTNGGQQWSNIGSSSGALNVIKGFDNNILYSAGINGIVLKTTNSGLNWYTNSNGFYDPLYAVHFIDANTGFIGGIDNKISRTTDGGLSWQTQYTEGVGKIKSITEVSNNIFAIGDNGLLLKSSNSGTNWEKIITPLSFSFCEIHFSDNLNGWIVGEGNQILKTTNGGQNFFTVIPNITGFFYGIHFINSLTGWISKRGFIAKSTDGGVTFMNQFADTNGRDLYYIRTISFMNSNTGIAAGNAHIQGPFSFPDYGFILRTVNGGNNWNFQNYSEGSSYPIKIFMNYQGICFLAGIEGLLLKSVNSGNNWFRDTIHTNLDFYSIDFVNNNTGWVVGDKGTILKTTNGGVSIGINLLNLNIPEDFDLYQNYPNPFNPQTKIKFAVPKVSFTKLIIYDLLGREVTTLVNEELKPGTYEADWDGSNFSSGVYFYKIITNDFVETKKMVLMK